MTNNVVRSYIKGMVIAHLQLDRLAIIGWKFCHGIECRWVANITRFFDKFMSCARLYILNTSDGYCSHPAYYHWITYIRNNKKPYVIYGKLKHNGRTQWNYYGLTIQRQLSHISVVRTYIYIYIYMVICVWKIFPCHGTFFAWPFSSILQCWYFKHLQSWYFSKEFFGAILLIGFWMLWI